MNVRKLSVNKACIFFAVLLLVAMGMVSAALYGLTQNITAVWYVLLFGIFVLVYAVCLWCWFAANWQCSPMLFAV